MAGVIVVVKDLENLFFSSIFKLNTVFSLRLYVY